MTTVRECDGLDHCVEKSLQECVDEIKLLEKDLNHVGESVAAKAREVESRMEKKVKYFEDQVRRFNLFREEKIRELELREGELSSKREALFSEMKLREEKVEKKEELLNVFIERLVASRNKIDAMQVDVSVDFDVNESLERKLEVAEELVAKREEEIDARKGLLDERMMDLEKKEKEFNSFQEIKMSDLRLKEKQLSIMEERLVAEFKSNDERLTKHEKSMLRYMQKLDTLQDKVKGSSILVLKRLKAVESREQNVRVAEELMAKRVKEVDMSKESLEKRIMEFEKRENEFNSFEKEKKRELELKEDQLSMMREEHVKEVQLQDKIMTDQERSPHYRIERLDSAQDEVNCPNAPIDKNLRKIGSQNRTSIVTHVAPCAKGADVIGKNAGKRLREVEKRMKKTHQQNKKIKAMVSQEERLSLMSEKLMKEVGFIDDKFEEQEKFVCGLVKRLELARNDIEELRTISSRRSNEISLKESDFKGKMDEVHSRSKQLEEHEIEINAKEEILVHKETELEGKENELEFMEKRLQSWEKELDIKKKENDSQQEFIEKREKKLDWREKHLNSVRSFVKTCFRKYLDLKKQMRSEKDLVLERERDPKQNQKQLEHDLRELKSMKKQIEDDFKDLKLRQYQMTYAMNAHVMMEPEESADLKFIVKMDGKTLQMFLNDPEKDTESIGDEVFKVLHLSSDPAKLVLDAMEGFYPPFLREGDLEYNVRNTCILLLAQLSKMEIKIKPCVKEEAIVLANEWKSKLKASPEYLLEILGLLHLLDAYDLTPYFDREELLSIMKIVAQQQQLPDLEIIIDALTPVPNEIKT